MAAKQAGQGNETLKAVLCVVLIPLALVIWGGWQTSRLPSQEDRSVALAQVDQNLAELDALIATHPGATVQTDKGRVLSIGQALREQHAYHDALSHPAFFGQILPRVLNIAELPLSVLAAIVGLLGLFYIRTLGQRARTSREALLNSFNTGRRVLPWLLGSFSLGVFGALACALGFELSRFVAHGVSGAGNMKIVLYGVIGICAVAMVGLRSLRNLLRVARSVFTPEPITVMGRTLSREMAPGLWAYVDGIAQNLGAHRPDAIVVGMDEGFFVTEVPVRLASGEAVPQGRVLYMPLPYMAYLDRQEVSAIIGHELGHFTGDDTRYSLNFAPIYASATNSLQAVFESSGGGASAGCNPVILLGEFFLRAFHEAVQHWSRQRELAADQFGAQGPGARAAASALLRTCALAPRVMQALAECWQAGNGNVLARTRELVAQLGMEDPSARLDYTQPHPTDSHPPLGQRLAALGVATPDADILARSRDTAGSRLLAELGLESAPAVTAVTQIVSDPSVAAPTNAPPAVASPAAGLAASLEAEFSQHAQAERNEHLSTLRKFAGHGLSTLHVREWHPWQILIAVLLGAVLTYCSMALGHLDTTMLSVCALGVALIVLAGYGVYRCWHTALTLNPEGILFAGGSSPLPWVQISDFDFSEVNGLLTVTLTLQENARPTPQILGRRGSYNARRHTTRFRLWGIKGYSSEDFLIRLREGWLGAVARAELAQIGEKA